MKTIGLLGGMSWESTLHYYRIINEEVRKRLGKLHSAKIVLYSVDFEEIEPLQRAGRWKDAGKILVDAAKNIENANADCILICANTMHKVSDDVQAKVKIPLLHIADATAEKIKAKNMRKVGLLGTIFTMEEDFYKGRLQRKYGLDVIVPEKNERREVNEIIFKELCLGIKRKESKEKLQKIISEFKSKGCEGVILGCTELQMLIQQKDVSIPIFDTTEIHAIAAVDFAMK